MESVSEKIDERILRLLGLEDVFDLDYDTYMTLLKEAIVTGSNKLPQEELAILANERKRVRGKKGRFKPKKDKVTTDKVSAVKFLKPARKTLALSSAISKSGIQQQDLTGIGKPLESIAKTLATLLSLRKKTSEEERKDKETQKRTKREEGLEGFKKGISAVSSAAKKMLAPFQNIIDRIWRFIFFTLLGRAFTQLMDWLGDPANKKKIDVLGRFLKDWWPTLLGAAVLFFTPFGKFVRSTLKLVGLFAGKLVKQIPLIAKAVKGLGAFAVANPLVTIGVTGAAATFGAEMRRQGEEKKQVESEAKRRGVKPETVKIELEQAKRSPFAMFGEAMQNIGGFAGGGSIPSLSNGYGGIDGNTGQKVSGFGPDTQMIVAQPGEVVMNKKAVDAVGADNLLAINRQYGGPGANKPKMGKLYNTGGIVGRNSGRQTSLPIRGGFIGNRSKDAMRLAGSLINVSPIDVMPPRPMTGFRDLAENQFRNSKGFKGFQGGGEITPQNLEKIYIQGQKSGMNSEVLRAIGDEAFLLKHFGVGGTWRHSKGSGATDMQGNILPLRRQGGGLIGGLDSFGRSVFENVGGSVGKNKGRETGLPGGGWFGEKLGERKGRDMYEKLTNPLRRQGGGLIEMSPKIPGLPNELGGGGGGTDALTEQAKVKTFGSAIKGFLFGEQKNTHDPQRYKGGGIIKENTGMNIRGATADRQLTALQPGEYVLPVDTVNRLGVSVVDRIVAMTDSNSNPYLGKGTARRPQITPLRRGQSGMMTLPPITQSVSGVGGGSAAGSKVPAFSASSLSGGVERSMNAGIYGIVG